jgi:autotransporter adhesin
VASEVTTVPVENISVVALLLGGNEPVSADCHADTPGADCVTDLAVTHGTDECIVDGRVASVAVEVGDTGEAALRTLSAGLAADHSSQVRSIEAIAAVGRRLAYLAQRLQDNAGLAAVCRALDQQGSHASALSIVEVESPSSVT